MNVHKRKKRLWVPVERRIFSIFRPIFLISQKKSIFVLSKTGNMENNEITTEEKIVKMLRTVYDPEIPVNVYDLGLIYSVETDDENNVKIEMTLTAPNCPAADFIVEDIRMKIESIEEVKSVDIQLVFEPEWDKEMMSEEAKLELGLL